MPGATILEVEYSIEMNNLISTGLDQNTLNKIILAIANKVGVTAGSLVSDPPVPTRKPLPVYYRRTSVTGRAFTSKFKSKEQQGYFFGVLLKGGDVPYTRGRGASEQLTAQLGLLPFTIRQTDKSFIIEAGVNASYAPLVVGSPDEQSDYHKGVWTPLEEDIASEAARQSYIKVINLELRAAFAAFSK